MEELNNEPEVFISYVRENHAEVQKLADVLRADGIKVWLDRDKIKPGYRWQDAIRKAITTGDFFIACFSGEYTKRSKTYMNEELTLAIEELRQRPTYRAWFIPVLLSECNIPDRSIGGSETLRSIQWVELYKDWDKGIKQILSVININPVAVDDKSISGLWEGPTGKLKLISNKGLVTGEYDWGLFRMSGHLNGRFDGKIITFEWHWEHDKKRGNGFFRYDEESNTLKGAWFLGSECVDLKKAINRKTYDFEHSWGFKKLLNSGT